MSQKSWIDYVSHPVRVTLRTYVLSLSLSLGPSLIPFIHSRITSKPSTRTSLSALKRVLRRECGLDGFAFAITVCVGGGAAIRQLWHILDLPTQQAPSIPIPQQSVRTTRRQINAGIQTLKLTSYQKTFLANILSSSLGVLLLQAGYRRSRRLRGSSNCGAASTRTNRALPTLDLTLLLFVRAADAIFQALIRSTTQPAHQASRKSGQNSSAGHTLFRNKLKENAKSSNLLTSRIDAFVFWACSARYIPYYYLPIRYPITHCPR